MSNSDITTKLIAYETGEMDDDDIIPFFQELIDTGLAWQLQGQYGRTAQQLIQVGYCHEKETT